MPLWYNFLNIPAEALDLGSTEFVSWRWIEQSQFWAPLAPAHLSTLCLQSVAPPAHLPHLSLPQGIMAGDGQQWLRNNSRGVEGACSILKSVKVKLAL